MNDSVDQEGKKCSPQLRSSFNSLTIWFIVKAKSDQPCTWGSRFVAFRVSDLARNYSANCLFFLFSL